MTAAWANAQFIPFTNTDQVEPNITTFREGWKPFAYCLPECTRIPAGE